MIEPPNEREAVQRDDGSYMCLQCHGDWYACECPRETSKPRQEFSVTLPNEDSHLWISARDGKKPPH